MLIKLVKRISFFSLTAVAITSLLLSADVSANLAPQTAAGTATELSDQRVTPTTTSTPPPTTTSTPPPTTTIDSNSLERILLVEYLWGSATDVETRELQGVLNISIDGIYGNQTRTAHVDRLIAMGLVLDGVPAVPVAAPKNACDVTISYSCYPGYSGNHQAELVEYFETQLPQYLIDTTRGLQIINGCTPSAAYIGRPVDPCTVNVFDMPGWGADGSTGNAWAYSIWISDATFSSTRKLEYVALHEASHAAAILVWRHCYTPEGVSYRYWLEDLAAAVPGIDSDIHHQELLADFMVSFWAPGASWRGSYTGSVLPSAELLAGIQEAVDSCDPNTVYKGPGPAAF